MPYSKECPCCGAALRLNEAAQTARCDACGSDFTPEELRVQTGEELLRLLEAIQKEKTDCSGFACEACGAELIAAEEAASAFCCYCGAPTVAPADFSDAVEPELLLPFEIDRREAQDRFVHWFGAKKLIPPCFSETARAGKISGLYVPFWLFDCTLATQLHAVSTLTETERTDRKENVTAKRFCHYRRVTVRYETAPADASERIDGRLMDLLGPFDLERLQPFDPALTAGIYCEKNSLSLQQGFERVREQLEAASLRAARDALPAERYAEVKDCRHLYQTVDAKYALLPVWLMTCRRNGFTHQFFMNGQTGKIVGEAPLSLTRALQWFGGAAAAAAVAGELIWIAVNLLF